MKDVTTSEASRKDADNLNDIEERWEYRIEPDDSQDKFDQQKQREKIDKIYEKNNLSSQSKYKAKHATGLLSARLAYLQRISSGGK